MSIISSCVGTTLQFPTLNDIPLKAFTRIGQYLPSLRELGQTSKDLYKKKKIALVIDSELKNISVYFARLGDGVKALEIAKSIETNIDNELMRLSLSFLQSAVRGSRHWLPLGCSRIRVFRRFKR